MRSERLSNLSCNESNQRNRNQRNRNIIWYNPPFDLQVKTNIGKTFLQLLDRNFPPHHRLHKIINKSTVKISYSSMPNMTSHISYHNKSIIQESKKWQHQNPKKCDCQVAENCLLNGNCKQSAVIHQADVTPEIDKKHTYNELTEGPFKERLFGHRTSFKYGKYKYKSKLSSFIWEIKNKGQNFEIRWSVIRGSNPYKVGSKKFNLRFWEKFHIMTEDKDKLLNERN